MELIVQLPEELQVDSPVTQNALGHPLPRREKSILRCRDDTVQVPEEERFADVAWSCPFFHNHGLSRITRPHGERKVCLS